jgi:hypothetical protein
MERKTLYALIAALVLGIGAYSVLHAPEKGQRKGPPPRPIPELKVASFGTLEITSDKQEKTTMANVGGRWMITQPHDWAADQGAVKVLTDGLEKLGFGDLVSESKAKFEDLGVAEGKAARVTVKDKSGALLADLFIGKPIAGFTMVRPAGKDEVWQTTGLVPYMVNKDPKGWRDHVILDVPVNDVEKLTVEGDGAKLSLVRDGDAKGNETRWKVAEATGDAPKDAAALDLATVNGAVQAAASLRAGDFADDKKPEEVGLAKPSVSLTLGTKDKTYTLLVGDTKGDDVYVKRADAPQIYTVKKLAIERLAHRPADYRDKTLAKAKEVDLVSIEITSGGETTVLKKEGTAWKSAGKVAVDANKAKQVASAFDNLAGSSFSTEKDPKKTGLAKPAGAVTLHLKDKSTVAFKVGSQTADKTEVYVQKVGSTDVLLVKKFTVDRFLKKPADLKK